MSVEDVAHAINSPQLATCTRRSRSFCAPPGPFRRAPEIQIVLHSSSFPNEDVEFKLKFEFKSVRRREWEREEAVARLIGAEDSHVLTEAKGEESPLDTASLAPRVRLGALSQSSLWPTHLPEGAPARCDEFTHEFHMLELWETPLSPAQDPSLRTWRCVAIAHHDVLLDDSPYYDIEQI